MKKHFKKALAFFAIGLLLILPASNAMASTASNVATVSLSLTVNSAVTCSASPGSLSFSSPSGAASGPITISCNWQISSLSNAVTIDAYFSSPSAALSSGSVNIPTSQVFGSVNGSTATPFTQTDTTNNPGTVPGATLPIGSSFNGNSSQTDALLLSISGLANVPPGSFTGNLNISAFAN